MQYQDIIQALQNLTGKKPKQREIADILGVRVNVIGQRASRGSEFSVDDIKKIGCYYNTDLFHKYQKETPEIDIIVKEALNDEYLKQLFLLIILLSSDNRKTLFLLAERLKILQIDAPEAH